MGKHTCNICGKTFNLKSDYTRHIQRKKSCENDIPTEDIYKCDICGYETTTKHHYIQHKNRKIPCKKVVNQQELIDRITILENEKKYDEHKINQIVDKVTMKIKQESTDKNEKIVDEKVGYIYMIQEREFISQNENIYKIGKTTTDIRIRANKYPKNSVLHYLMMVNDCDIIEKKIFELFDREFTKMTTIGREYYKGNLKSMMRKINTLIDEVEPIQVTTIDTNINDIIVE